MTDTSTTTPAAKRKTPAERAEERLGIETRRVEKLEAEEKRLKAELAEVGEKLVAARKRRDYAANDPDLPQDEEHADAAPDDDGDGLELHDAVGSPDDAFDLEDATEATK